LCINSTYYLMGSISDTCTNCTHIAISPVIAGVEYQCWANTSRSGVTSIKYKAIDFNTSKWRQDLLLNILFVILLALQPVLYENTVLPNTDQIILNVTPQSDFDNIESVCEANDKQKSLCSDIRKKFSQCSTALSLTLSNNRGCDYQCLFLTKKQGYADARSETFSVSIRK
jgi:hypothetical protein